MSDRLIALQGSFNFRDLGGYRGAGGRRVRWGRLFRADGLHRLSDADLVVLGELDIRTVIDLRTAGELTDHGRITWPGRSLDYHNLPMMDVLPEQREFNETWAHSDGVSSQYLSILANASPAVTAALGILTESSSYPAVIHCMAGKDRTGILLALVLGFLGVAEDDIVADYALSAPAMERMLASYRAARPERAEALEASSAAMVHAEPATMASFLTGLRAEHGSFEGYADSVGCGDVPRALRELLLEP